jgi:membrane protein YdbS with pleckstrin-like domain
MYSSFRSFCERLLRIPHDPLPPPGDEASTRIFRAASNFYRYLLFLWTLKAALALFIMLISIFVPSTIIVWQLTKSGKAWGTLLLLIPVAALIILVLVNLFMLAVVRLEFEKRWYVVTDRSLRIRDGVTTVREMTVNFANIQNISISQGPVQRALRIADLRVDTAGGGGAVRGQQGATENLHTAWFRGIDNANEVRELIQQRLHHLKDSGLGDHEELAHTARSTAFSPATLNILREIHTEAIALRLAAADPSHH